MQVQEIMTAAAVTADADDEVREVARLMRDHNVGSVVIRDPGGAPAAMITDRDLATRIVTLDDIAVRTRDLDVAQRMTHKVIEGALPEFFFHDRG
jgi:signal-transduction protein with cAMP-binding, CBS, and nucleotidyltransferase domain